MNLEFDCFLIEFGYFICYTPVEAKVMINRKSLELLYLLINIFKYIKINIFKYRAFEK